VAIRFCQNADTATCGTWVVEPLYLLNEVLGFEPFATRFAGGDFARLLDRAVTQGTGSFVLHLLGLVFAVTLAGFLYSGKIFLRVDMIWPDHEHASLVVRPGLHARRNCFACGRREIGVPQQTRGEPGQGDRICCPRVLPDVLF
jgi:hypothetical protein